MNVQDHIGLMFGRKTDGSYNVPSDLSGKTSEILPLIERIAEARGETPDEVLSLDWISLLESWLCFVVRNEALQLRLYARQNGLHHLELTLAEAMAEQAVKALHDGSAS
ncbi:hypothetical protein ACIBQ1_09450 [Nonomuraea sp. NPDC050153]|uniref:hypothetical protein n=1 Tax=Nonomuraea sp. NPDC050153 TaxID=3364359 RepID=UPI0037B8F0D3